MGAVSGALVRTTQPGDVLFLAPPQGDFVLPEHPRPLLMLTAGSGITPVMSMIRTLVPHRPDADVVLIHSARTRERRHLPRGTLRARRPVPQLPRHPLVHRRARPAGLRPPPPSWRRSARTGASAPPTPAARRASWTTPRRCGRRGCRPRGAGAGTFAADPQPDHRTLQHQPAGRCRARRRTGHLRGLRPRGGGRRRHPLLDVGEDAGVAHAQRLPHGHLPQLPHPAASPARSATCAPARSTASRAN